MCAGSTVAPMALFIGRTGQIAGVLPFSRMKNYGGQGFAVSPVWALLVHHSQFPEMLAAIPSMAQRVVSTLLDRVREVTRIEQQAEKLTAPNRLAGARRAVAAVASMRTIPSMMRLLCSVTTQEMVSET